MCAVIMFFWSMGITISLVPNFCSYFSLDVKFETSFLGFRLLLASLVLALHGLGNPINRPRVTKPGLLDTQKISNGFARI